MNNGGSIVDPVMTEFVKRLHHTFGCHLRYVGTTTSTDKDSGDIDVLVLLEQLSDTHIRYVWDIVTRLRSNWNIVLDCRIRSSKDLPSTPPLEAYLLSRFLKDYYGENPFLLDGPTPADLRDACRQHIEHQEQRILSLLPRVAFDPARLREVGQSVFDAARGLLILNGTPEINKRDACGAIRTITEAFDDITNIYDGYLNAAAVINVPSYIADALALVKHMAYRAQSYQIANSVLLVNIPSMVAPHPVEEVVGFDANMPLGLVCIASYLCEQGVDVRIIDAYAHNLSASGVIDEIAKQDRLPRIVGLNSASPNIQVVFTLAKYLKRISQNVVVVCGGPHATLATEHTLSCPYIDYVVAGEGEVAFHALCRRLMDKAQENAPIPAIFYKASSGIVTGTRGPNNFQLRNLPRPRFDLLPLANVYFRKRKRLYVHTTRGCPFRCIYCSVHNFWSGTVREIPMEVLFDHITYILERFQPDEIQVVDDNFSHKRGERIKDFCRYIAERHMTFKWKCQVRADQLTTEHVEMMQRSGCFEVDVGIESGNQEVQHRIKKGLRLEQTRSFVAALHANNLIGKGFFILGFPGESWRHLQDTINFAVELKRIGLTDVAFFPAMPFPGTELGTLAMAITGKDILQGAIMDEALIPDRSFASHRLRKYSAMPEISVNAIYNSRQLRTLAKFAYEHFESSQSIEDLKTEFEAYQNQEEALLYGF